ncbi:glycoside hydrolase family 3 N-terminal domain-containing protein [Microbacterium sp. X-17]|uniref:glycoside hydrolase family 3 protein n=1 Tax=Microbacterium sp. X-17 TaxID=3144404 RepID=UPI0031F51E0D
MDAYLDPAYSPERRAADLAGRMTVAEKAGLLFQPSTTPVGEAGRREAIDDVTVRLVSHFNVLDGEGSEEIARWHNTLQEMAESTRLGIPVTLSSDPRHGFRSSPFTGQALGSLSRWPETTGIAAIDEPGAAARFGETVRREMLAMGVRVYLGPMADIYSEPRWSRGFGTFGEDPERVSALTAEFIRALRGGAELGPDSVAAVVKHFPGAGPQKDGDDAHDARYKEQVYPGGRQALHLRPFEAAFQAGATQVMTYYGMPVGTDWDEVGFAFNEPVVQGLLRQRLGFGGIVVTDWNVIDAAHIGGMTFGPNGWGLEDRTPLERLRIALNAGVDQFGGDRGTELIEELVDSGELPAKRLDASVIRLLTEKFRLGLFERRRVDPARAGEICGAPDVTQLGLDAQEKSLVLLKDGNAGGGIGSLVEGSAVYADGCTVPGGSGFVAVADPAAAEAIVVRLDAPFESGRGSMGDFFHGGSLAFPATTLEKLRGYAASAPVFAAVYLERPAVLQPLLEIATVVVGEFGVGDDVLFGALGGRTAFTGRLPFDIPSSMPAVEASREDVPFDTADPTFRAGYGLVSKT